MFSSLLFVNALSDVNSVRNRSTVYFLTSYSPLLAPGAVGGVHVLVPTLFIFSCLIQKVYLQFRLSSLK